VKVNYDKSVGRNAWFGNELSGRESLPLRPIPDLAVNGMAVLKSVLLVATDHITVSSSYRSEVDKSSSLFTHYVSLHSERNGCSVAEG